MSCPHSPTKDSLGATKCRASRWKATPSGRSVARLALKLALKRSQPAPLSQRSAVLKTGVKDFRLHEATSHRATAAPTSVAARAISSATSVGWDTIATWLEGISTVVAPMRAANWRSASGGIASSFWATRGSAAPAGGLAALWVVPPPGARSGAQTPPERLR